MYIVAYSSTFPDSDSTGVILWLYELWITDNNTKYKINLVYRHANELFRVERPTPYSHHLYPTPGEKIILCPFAHLF